MRTCKNCKTELVRRMNKDGYWERLGQFSRRYFCSKRCVGDYKTKTRNIEKACFECDKVFSVHMSCKKQKYCSVECRNKSFETERVERTCQHCGGKFYAPRWHVKNAPMKYCSVKCYGKSMFGEGSFHWKGGRELAALTSMHKRRAQKLASGGSHTSKEWVALKEKHDCSCLCCGEREPDIKLCRDHVIPLILGGSNSIDNIQPLCVSCNSKKHVQKTDYRPSFLANSVV